MSRSRSNYTKLPAVPPEVVPRLTAVLAVLSGLKTMSAAARELGLSRNRFQSLMHRSIAALVLALAAQAAGRPPQSPALRRLRAENTQLKRDNARLASRVAMGERLSAVMGEVLQGRTRASGRQPRRRSPGRSTGDGGAESEPEGRRRRLLTQVDRMRELKLSAVWAARVAGVGASTLRRWRARRTRGMPLVVRRRARVDLVIAGQAEERVRELGGQIGAAALSHAIRGLSRRAAAAVKAATLTAFERERKTQLIRIRVMAPGVLRGLDAMHLPERSARYALIAADGAIPYRTSVTVGGSYDGALVVQALNRDLDAGGVPLVYRLDRARSHDTPAVRALLAAHRVLVLQGPPHHPGYYGQLERQNREHRTWLRCVPVSGVAPEARLRQMLDRVNRLWPRRSLGWQTAAAAWSARPPITVDRQALHEEVQDRAARIARTLSGRGQPADLAERLAIEQTLTRIGYLRQEIGGWC